MAETKYFSALATYQTSLKDLSTSLTGFLQAGEDDIKNKIQELNTLSGTQLNQAKLLEVQVAIQGWSVGSGIATGVLRAVGDGLSKVTQNIR